MKEKTNFLKKNTVQQNSAIWGELVFVNYHNDSIKKKLKKNRDFIFLSPSSLNFS